MKNRYLIKILLILGFIATAFAGANIQTFQAIASGDNVNLEWQVSDETNVQYYVIQRQTPQTNFIDVARIPANGSSVYKYTDQSIYKTNDVMLTYQIGVIYFGDPNIYYLKQTRISLSISGIRRTWGSIKAMFR